MSEDMLNVMGSFISTELDAFENLHKELKEKDKEIERLNEECDTYMKIATKRGNIIKEIKDNLENSIKSINEKLESNKEPFEVINGEIQYINEYRVVRLKGIRTKCKELLKILDKEDK